MKLSYKVVMLNIGSLYEPLELHEYRAPRRGMNKVTGQAPLKLRRKHGLRKEAKRNTVPRARVYDARRGVYVH